MRRSALDLSMANLPASLPQATSTAESPLLAPMKSHFNPLAAGIQKIWRELAGNGDEQARSSDGRTGSQGLQAATDGGQTAASVGVDGVWLYRSSAPQSPVVVVRGLDLLKVKLARHFCKRVFQGWESARYSAKRQRFAIYCASSHRRVCSSPFNRPSSCDLQLS